MQNIDQVAAKYLNIFTDYIKIDEKQITSCLIISIISNITLV